jgi:uncharacterized membrane protein YdjX (TVP38/TMEM64 family)
MARLEPVAGGDRGPSAPVARPGRRLALLAGLVLGGALAAWALGLGELLSPARLGALRAAIEAQGGWAPALFVLGYVLAELVFVPALPLTLLGGALFGPLRGTACVSVAATTAAGLAFLIARYLARDAVERWLAGNPRLRRIDAAVAEHGWRILVVTRLVPLFPFNVQNFAYGLTRIPFGTFMGVSWVAMLPGTAAYAVAGAALTEGGDLRRTTLYLAAAGVIVVVLSLLPGWLARRSRAAGELLRR